MKRQKFKISFIFLYLCIVFSVLSQMLVFCFMVDLNIGLTIYFIGLIMGLISLILKFKFKI